MQKALGLVMLTAGFPGAAMACELAAGFQPVPFAVPEPIPPGTAPAPDVTVESISRGTRAPDVLNTCHPFAAIVLTVSDPTAGYRFELVQGTVKIDNSEGRRLFPVGAVAPLRGVLRFQWDDGWSYAQEPIDIVVRVTAVWPSGTVSEPRLIKITHPGIP